MFKKIILLITTVSLCLLIVLLNVTTPATAGPFGILIIFIFAYFSSIGLMTNFLYWISRLITHLSTGIVTRKPFEPLTLRRSYYYSTVIAAAPIMLIGLQSVGTVGFYEFLLVFIFIIIGCLYTVSYTHLR